MEKINLKKSFRVVNQTQFLFCLKTGTLSIILIICCQKGFRELSLQKSIEALSADSKTLYKRDWIK